ncbi:hypothetical protein [Zavarzinia compransoris]|uniref:Uncharacterized protein n=1 Tax=Zavarzinia compransoris TaxID=1264899 RepID=A0A317E711_9PROT|nr:hypothetical protein [Zavarzinia compransoris]PWR20855.1 hypothetical protein DKG75_12755 [Zavarzinia compransoris]TDP44309.1 hypothetical protein DES42_10774 [Zavarzinia compransoris]
MTTTDLALAEGLDRWRGLINARDRREKRSRWLTTASVWGVWGLYALGFGMTVTSHSLFGALFGAAGLIAGLLPAAAVSGGLYLARNLLSRRAGLAVLGPRHAPARDAFEPHLPTIAGVVADADRLAFDKDERRLLEAKLDQLAGLYAALRHMAGAGDRDHARQLAAGVPALVRELADLRRRALGRTISGSLPPGTTPGLLSGDNGRLPRLVSPSVEKLSAALALAGQSDRPATLAAARRAQDSAERALAALRADAGLTLRTRDLIDGLAGEVAQELEREKGTAAQDPRAVIEIEERLMKARQGEA